MFSVFFLLYNMVRVFFFLITNITIYYFGYSGYSVSMKIINSRYAFDPQGWELKFFNSQRHYFANKGPSSQSYGFSINHVWMWELDYKESWVPKNWCFWTVVLEETLESPLNCKEIQPVYPKGSQSWIFTGRTDAKAETPIPCPPDAKNWPIWKDRDARKDWRQEEKGMTEDGMVGWHDRLNGHEFE